MKEQVNLFLNLDNDDNDNSMLPSSELLRNVDSSVKFPLETQSLRHLCGGSRWLGPKPTRFEVDSSRPLFQNVNGSVWLH